MGKSVLTNIAGCFQNKNLSLAFCGDNFTSKGFNELPLVESLFNTKQNYGVQPRTLLNSIEDDFMRMF